MPPRRAPADDDSALQWRMHSHTETTVELELFGTTFRLAQNPASMHLGTTVWDASIVVAKMLEKGSVKEFTRARLKGRRALELGAGVGLAGLAAAALGATVTLTDVPDVLPLLAANADRNLSRSALAVAGVPWAGDAGAVAVAALDWDDEATWHPGGNTEPYDIVLAADCVYSETAVPSFVAALLAHTHRRTSILVANELRSHSVAAAFEAGIEPHFTVKRVPRAKQDPTYSHSSIHLMLLKRKDASGAAAEPAATVETPEH